MMKFEDLEVWKRAARLSADIYRQLLNLKDYGFKDQITRSGLSVPSNIAEGFERESQKENIAFLSYAKGSCGELRCQTYIGMDITLLTVLHPLNSYLQPVAHTFLLPVDDTDYHPALFAHPHILRVAGSYAIRPQHSPLPPPDAAGRCIAPGVSAPAATCPLCSLVHLNCEHQRIEPSRANPVFARCAVLPPSCRESCHVTRAFRGTPIGLQRHATSRIGRFRSVRTA